MSITSAEGVGSLCARHPLAVPLFHELGLELADPTRSLAACCHDRGLAVTDVTSSITAAEQGVTMVWHGCAVSELLDHILRTYHRPFAHEVAELVGAIESARSYTQHATWSVLLQQVADLSDDLENHIEIEERVVFPWLRGHGTAVTMSIRAMQLEHADAIALLLSIENSATQCVDADAGNTHNAVVAARLRHFERFLCEYIHFESNELFPRALQAEITRR